MYTVLATSFIFPRFRVLQLVSEGPSDARVFAHT
jgi:hypothetical protein